jgi:very-short-patch-repair endonuclease
VRGNSERARELRRRQTDAEQRLGHFLRDRRLCGYKFRRQHPIGPFFADFACPDRRLVVELDGGQHVESRRDERRTAVLVRLGWRVVRYWDDDVLLSTNEVLESILRNLS